MKFEANKALEERLLDLQRGLQEAMEQLIRRGDKDAAELILRQVDDRLTQTINQTTVV